MARKVVTVRDPLEVRYEKICSIPAAAKIEAFQASIADPSVAAPRDYSGLILGSVASLFVIPIAFHGVVALI